MPSHSWSSHVIEVQSFAMARFCWLAIELKVFVDGRLAGMSAGRPRLRARIPFEIQSERKTSKGYVESGRFNSVLRTGYRIVVDGEDVGAGSVIARNWYLTYIAISILALVMLELLIVSLGHSRQSG